MKLTRAPGQMSISTEKILVEEQEGRDLSLSHAIHTADVPSEDISQRDKDIERLANKYEDVFKSREDAEYFAMLPLSRQDRERVLVRARHFMSSPGV